jgi:hypothetical protein
MEHIIGRPSTIIKRGNCLVVTSHSVQWKPLLQALGLIELYDNPRSGWKRKVCVPDFILCSPLSVVKEFISALFESDGHAFPYYSRTTLSASSGVFLRDVQLLLLAFGLNSRVRREALLSCKVGGEKKYEAHLLSLNADASDLFHQRIGFISIRKQAAYIGVVKPQKGAKRKPNRMVDTALTIVPAGVCNTYDLTIQDSHIFGANGILVHNCATPEESFQFTGNAQFSVETLERIRLGTINPHYYELNVQQ